MLASLAQLRDGTLLAGLSRWGDKSRGSGGQDQLIFRSTDNGTTWTGPVVLMLPNRQPNEGSFVELDTGEVVCYIRDDEPSAKNGMKSISRDGGRTWGPLYGCGAWRFTGRPDVGLLSTGEIFLTSRVGAPQKGHWFGAYRETQEMALEPTPLDGPVTPGTISFLIEDDTNPVRPDCGYSGWVELPDRSIYVVQYITTAEAPAHKAFIRGYRISPGYNGLAQAQP